MQLLVVVALFGAGLGKVIRFGALPEANNSLPIQGLLEDMLSGAASQNLSNDDPAAFQFNGRPAFQGNAKIAPTLFPQFPAKGESNDELFSNNGTQNDELISQSNQTEADEVPPPGGFPVTHLIADRKMQYLWDSNTRHILEHTSDPAVVANVTATYDADRDGIVSIHEWNDFFNNSLAPYFQDKLGLAPVSFDMWAAVSRDGHSMSVTGDMYPTLHSMVTEDIFDGLAAALFYEFDADKDGHLNDAEWATFRAAPAYLPKDQIPPIPHAELQREFSEIEAAQGSEAVCKIIARFAELGKPLQPFAQFPCNA